MIVYMTRKERQALANVIAELYPIDGEDCGRRQGSVHTLSSALDLSLSALEYVDGSHDDAGFAGEAIQMLTAVAAACQPRLPRRVQPSYLAIRLRSVSQRWAKAVAA